MKPFDSIKGMKSRITAEIRGIFLKNICGSHHYLCIVKSSWWKLRSCDDQRLMKFWKTFHKARDENEDLELELIEWIQQEGGEFMQLSCFVWVMKPNQTINNCIKR